MICELDRSNSQQGYDWTKSFVFLEARNGKWLKLVHLVADLSSQTPRRGAENSENLVCNTGKE